MSAQCACLGTLQLPLRHCCIRLTTPKRDRRCYEPRRCNSTHLYNYPLEGLPTHPPTLLFSSAVISM